MILDILVGLIAIAAITAIAVKFRNKRKQDELDELENGAALVNELLEALANLTPEQLARGEGLPEGWEVVVLKNEDAEDEIPTVRYESTTKH